ncbi:dihydroorotate dehydrogenase [Candidatus Micrarchaeota archaeon]|nr:dihydroorotate dehydrogenase [Candidatus Micrarchaeota archaeon]
MADVSTELAGIRFKSPTILASGILGTSKKVLERVCSKGAGGITTKSITIEPRKGHNSPIVVDFGGGMLNAVGYANPGIEKALEEFDGWEMENPLIFSITAKDCGEYEKIAGMISKIKVSAVEIALSCPHTPGYGLLAGQGDPASTFEITKSVKKKINVPLIVKLSPSVPAIGEVAKSAEKGGADAVNMGNTAGPGMVIDLERKRPFLDFKFGGMSGPAVLPLAVRCVYDVYKAVKIPVIGTGGVTYGKDALQMIMAGASAVGIGTAVYYRGIESFSLIEKEMKEWMESNGYKKIKELVGVAHE